MEITSFARAIAVNLYLWLWLLLALSILWATKTHRQARRLGAILLLGLWLLGTRPAAEAVLRPLESRYAAPALSGLQARGVRQVVVLMGGSFPPRGELLSFAVGASTLSRFAGAGLDPIPYPVDFQVFGDYRWEDWLPTTDNLVTEEGALKEYLGLLYYAIRGSPPVP